MKGMTFPLGRNKEGERQRAVQSCDLMLIYTHTTVLVFPFAMSLKAQPASPPCVKAFNGPKKDSNNQCSGSTGLPVHESITHTVKVKMKCFICVLVQKTTATNDCFHYKWACKWLDLLAESLFVPQRGLHKSHRDQDDGFKLPSSWAMCQYFIVIMIWANIASVHFGYHYLVMWHLSVILVIKSTLLMNIQQQAYYHCFVKVSVVILTISVWT